MWIKGDSFSLGECYVLSSCTRAQGHVNNFQCDCEKNIRLASN